MRLWMRRNGLNPQGSFFLYPRAYHGFYRVTNARVTKQAEHDTREALRRFLHG